MLESSPQPRPLDPPGSHNPAKPRLRIHRRRRSQSRHSGSESTQAPVVPPGTRPWAPSCESSSVRDASGTTPRDDAASSQANPRTPRRTTPPMAAGIRTPRGSRLQVPPIPGSSRGNRPPGPPPKRLSGSRNDNASSDRPMAESSAYGHGCTSSDGRRQVTPRAGAERRSRGLTRRRPSDTPAPCPPSGNDRSVREIRSPVARNNPRNQSSDNPGNNTGRGQRIAATLNRAFASRCPENPVPGALPIGLTPPAEPSGWPTLSAIGDREPL